MKRREFITLLGTSATAWPLAARAQQVAPVIGVLQLGGWTPQFNAAFVRGLAEAGYVDGRNVAVRYRLALDDMAALRELAADLVRQRVSVIAAAGSTPVAVGLLYRQVGWLLPFENATGAAKALGLTFPTALLVRADEVIE